MRIVWFSSIAQPHRTKVNMKFLLQSFLLPNNSPILTNLERLVATRAVGSSIISNLSTEVSIERVLIEFTNLNFHTSNIFNSTNVWVLSVLIMYIYGQYKLNQGVNTKLKDITIYDKYYRFIRELFFIFFIVFTSFEPTRRKKS